MSTNDFWNFSVQHYCRPGVAESCLTLQDGYDLDVNLLLFCIWYGQNFGELSAAQIDRAMKFSTLWATDVVKPLRQSRRWIKLHKEKVGIPLDGLEKFRDKVKRLELEAEQLQQDHLQQLLTLRNEGCQHGSFDAVSKNLDSYLQSLGIEKNASIGQHLEKIAGDD